MIIYQHSIRRKNFNQVISVLSNNFSTSLLLLLFTCLIIDLQTLSATERPVSVGKKTAFNIVSLSQNVSFKYDVDKFKSGGLGLSKPVVSVPGGTFSYTRQNVDTNGGLSLNTVNGWISHKNSNPGTYNVTYTYKSTKISVTVIVE